MDDDHQQQAQGVDQNVALAAVDLLAGVIASGPAGFSNTMVERHVLLAGPEWTGSAPAGVKGVIRSTTQFAFVIFRTQLFGPDDMPNVIAVQRGYRAQPLSAFLGRAAPPAAPEIRWPRINAELAKHHFFEYLDFVMQFSAPQPNEAAIRARMAGIGIGAGGNGQLPPLSWLDRIEMDLGAFEGERKVEAVSPRPACR